MPRVLYFKCFSLTLGAHAQRGLLLRQLQASGLGLTINKDYAGGYMHADDIRTLATSEETLTRQIALVKTFTERETFQT